MSDIQLQADATTLILNGRPITDLVDGDILTLTPVNELSTRSRSARGVNIQKRSDSVVYDLAFTVAKYSDDDIWLTAQLNKDLPEVFEGSAKENYTKDGTEVVSSWRLESGSFTAQPVDTRNNIDGNNAMLYTIQFNSAVRS